MTIHIRPNDEIVAFDHESMIAELANGETVDFSDLTCDECGAGPGAPCEPMCTAEAAVLNSIEDRHL